MQALKPCHHDYVKSATVCGTGTTTKGFRLTARARELLFRKGSHQRVTIGSHCISVIVPESPKKSVRWQRWAVLICYLWGWGTDRKGGAGGKKPMWTEIKKEKSSSKETTMLPQREGNGLWALGPMCVVCIQGTAIPTDHGSFESLNPPRTHSFH